MNQNRIDLNMTPVVKSIINEESGGWDQIATQIKSNWVLIFSVTLIALVLGVWEAISAPKTFEANAVIAPKKTAGGGGVLSQLGGLGGMISSQMGVSVTGNERLAFSLGTREVIGRVIIEQNLLPILYPDRWDSIKKTWKKSKKPTPPTLPKAVETFRKKSLRIMINPKKEIINLSITLTDSALVAPVAEAFLRELNENIRSRVRLDAQANREYLEQQLLATSDPLLREKLQTLIAGEIEKAMLVGSFAFDVLESPIPPFEKKGPNRKRMVAMAFSMGLIGSISLALLIPRILALLAFFNKQKPI